MPESPPAPAPPRPAPRRGDPLVGRTVSHYRVDERLGGGGMGVVYRARDLTLGRDVALKFLPPSLHRDAAAREQLLQEARAASALDHAHVASVYEIGEADDGRLFLAMAYYDGQTVEELVAEGPLPARQAVDIALQAGAGLARAHRAGVVHRDVKPANLIVTADGVVKVLDFGIAQAEGDDGTDQTSGSAPYMSPEQAQGLATDARTDVWGLGVTLYEMLTGRPPFSGAFRTAILYSVLHTDPRPVEELCADLPAPLCAAVAKSLAKDPADRYPTVDAFLDDLRAATAPPPEAAPGGAGWIGGMLRKGRLRTLLAVAVPLLGAAVVWDLWPSGPAEQHLVVLPFTAAGGDAEAEEFADGLVETITGRLSQLEQFGDALLVISASEVRSGMTIAYARDQLGATLAVGGVVQVEGDRVRLLLTLSDAETQRQITTRQVDVDEGSALAIQDEAVLEIAQMLEVEVEPQARDVLLAGGTDDDEANALYLRGRGVLRSEESLEDVEEAVDLFRRAIQRDPDFALAHAGLGQALWEEYRITGTPDRAAAATVAIERALSLDPNQASVQVALATIRAGRQQYGLALEAVDRALQIDPQNAEAVRQQARVYQDQGRVEEAETSYRRAIALRPGDWKGYNDLGGFYYISGRFEDAAEAYRRALGIVPGNLQVLSNVGATLFETSRLDEAKAVFERVLRSDPNNTPAWSNLATTFFYQGDYARAADLYAGVRAQQPDSPYSWLYLGDARWWAPGQRERAEDAYRSALRAGWAQLGVSRSPDVVLTLALTHARLGSRDSAYTYLSEFTALATPDGTDPYSALGVGETYEALGDRDQAVRWVQSALDRGYGHVTVAHSPWLVDLAQDIDLLPPSP